MRSILIPLLAVAVLGACQAGDTRQSSTTEANATPAEERAPVSSEPSTTREQNELTSSGSVDDAECGADMLGRWLNILPTETVKDEIAETVGERPIRYYAQGDPITMDFNPARLNVELGADGRIKLFRCG